MGRASPLMRTPTRHYNDRRVAPRLRTFLRTDCCCFIKRTDGLQVHGMRRAVATDLSSTGLFLSGAGYLKLGSLVRLYLRLPDLPGNPVVCYGRVVRTEPDGHGLQLLQLRHRDEQRLTRFVRVQLARSGRGRQTLAG